jgi:hypothetical protein
MLFLAIYKPHTPSEELDKRTLQLFTNWQPPFEFKGHWARGDGQGGVAIFEADGAEQVLEGIAPWGAFLDFEVTPAVEIQNAVPIFAKVNEWRDSVS